MQKVQGVNCLLWLLEAPPKACAAYIHVPYT